MNFYQKNKKKSYILIFTILLITSGIYIYYKQSIYQENIRHFYYCYNQQELANLLNVDYSKESTTSLFMYYKNYTRDDNEILFYNQICLFFHNRKENRITYYYTHLNNLNNDCVQYSKFYSVLPNYEKIRSSVFLNNIDNKKEYSEIEKLLLGKIRNVDEIININGISPCLISYNLTQIDKKYKKLLLKELNKTECRTELIKYIPKLENRFDKFYKMVENL